MTKPLLSIRNLCVKFPHRLGDFTAVHDLSLDVSRGEIFGLIGESGAGKSTVGNAIMHLLEGGHIAGGEILLDSVDLTILSNKQMAELRGRKIGMIFQDPMTSLNPLLTVGNQLSETIAHCQGLSREQAWKEARVRLEAVGIPDAGNKMTQYPHEFSGGMRQRVVIALALAGDPELLIADEPTTALDVSVQKQILDLLKALCAERNLAVILVTHDMGVIAETAHRVCVMQHGRMVETGATAEVLANPTQEYTRNLIASIPRIDKRDPSYLEPKVAMRRDIDAWLKTDIPSQDQDQNFVSCSGLTKDFLVANAIRASARKIFRAVEDVSFEIACGEVMGLVGESGSGKTTVGRMVAGLIPVTQGKITYARHGDVTSIRDRTAIKRFRRDVQVIFQDPYSSLNPRMRIGHILAEPISFHKLAKSGEVPRLVSELLERVGLKASDAAKFPHQFSGGQRQRICIARALAVRPRFLLCDEPTSALDVSIQADVLSLLAELKRDLGLTMLFVSHDLAVIRQICDRVAVMRSGRLIELQDSEHLFEEPQDPYTRMLLETAPRVAPQAQGQ